MHHTLQHSIYAVILDCDVTSRVARCF